MRERGEKIRNSLSSCLFFQRCNLKKEAFKRVRYLVYNVFSYRFFTFTSFKEGKGVLRKSTCDLKNNWSEGSPYA
ncbi:hypothetical protein OAF63_06515, partial [Saprospiraceae bacterium]|nr:hypothetical protein [Saprospiraceae bacterium]